MTVYDLAGTERVLADFSLTIEKCCLEEGGIYAVTGPNGCGKSTFLNLLSLADRPSSGEIVFNGEKVRYGDSDRLLELKRRIGYLMQNPYLFNMSVYNNISYGLRVRGISKAEIRKKVEGMMARLSLTHLAGTNAHALSGGEAQKVALARTLVLDTDVFLMDEPTESVDQRNVYVVEDLIRELVKKRKATVIFATHSRDQAYRLSNNIITIIDGKIRDIAYENVFSGVLVEETDGLNTIKLAEKMQFKTARGKKGRVTIAIDPNDIILSNEELTSSALNRFEGTITKIEDVNGSLRVFVNAGVTLCALITRKSFLNMGFNIGKSVWVTFKANAVKII